MLSAAGIRQQSVEELGTAIAASSYDEVIAPESKTVESARDINRIAT
jgi:hypothetical protein